MAVGTEIDGTNHDATKTGMENLAMENRDKMNLDVIRAVENHRAVRKAVGTKTVAMKIAGTNIAVMRVVATKTELRIGIMTQIDRITHRDTTMVIDLAIDPMAEVDLTEVENEIKTKIDREVEIETMNERLETVAQMTDLEMIDLRETSDPEMIGAKEWSKSFPPRRI